jgi:hypothetical protein
VTLLLSACACKTPTSCGRWKIKCC